MTDREKHLLWKVCWETDKLQVELSPKSQYPTPSAEETRERLLRIMDTLQELQEACGMASPPREEDAR